MFFSANGGAVRRFPCMILSPLPFPYKASTNTGFLRVQNGSWTFAMLSLTEDFILYIMVHILIGKGWKIIKE